MPARSGSSPSGEGGRSDFSLRRCSRRSSFSLRRSRRESSFCRLFDRGCMAPPRESPRTKKSPASMKGRARRHRPSRYLSDRADVRSLQALGPLVHFELHLLPLGERAKAFRHDGGVMAEYVRTTVVLHDESEALRVVEPLHGTSDHFSRHFFQLATAPCRRAACCSGRVFIRFACKKRTKSSGALARPPARPRIRVLRPSAA